MITRFRGRIAAVPYSLFLLGIAATLAACASGPRPVQTARAGSTILKLSAPGGRLLNGSNTVTV
ncbi:MAG: hypothetical protein KGR26_10935, partial [Cyanobacteria bacterium REEB65]|nr:hypothetical protein [Cyanobacteria bacterium REEB65]